MAFNGAGAFSRTDGVRSGADVHAQQKTANIKVRADLTDTELEDMATGMELAVLRDGQNSASANLPMGGFKHTGVTTSSGGSSRSEYAASAVVQDGAILDAGDTAGTTTAYTATLTPAITAYANKQLFRVKYNATFGANPTINFNGVGAKKQYYMLAGTATQLTTSNVLANYVGLLRYDTSLDTAAGAFLLLNPPGELFAPAAASDTVAGKIELATQAEVDTGTDAVRAVTPATLRGLAASSITGAQVAIATDTTRGSVEFADQSELEAASSNVLVVTPGRVKYHPGVAKAWVKFNGAGTPDKIVSSNVSSITDNGAGDWTVNFTTSFSSANYCGVLTPEYTGGTDAIGFAMLDNSSSGQAAGSSRIRMFNSGFVAYDVDNIHAAFFGDQ